MSSRTPALLSDFQATTVVGALKRNARQLVLFSALVGIATFAALSMIAPRYQSEAKLAIVAQDAPSTKGEMTPAVIGIAIRYLQSPFLLESVVRDLALSEQREFNSALGPADAMDATLRAVGLGEPHKGGNERDRVLTALRDNLDIHVADSGRAICIQAASRDPELSAKIANAIAETYGKMLSQEVKIDQMGSAAPDGASRVKAEGPAPRLEVKILSKASPDPVPTFPKKIELSTIASIAVLMFGIASVVMMTALRAVPKDDSKRGVSAKKRADPLLRSLPEDPLLKEMTDGDVTPNPEIGQPEVLPSAFNAVAAADPAAQAPLPPTLCTEIEILASRLKERRPSGGGHRALITSNVQQIIPFPEAFELAKTLASSGAQTILIDWSPSGEGFSRAVGLEAKVGWNDLMSRGARFDHIIQQLPGTHAQAIASGDSLRSVGVKMDADLLNLALDALDEVYDHIVVTARHDEARALFECIEGRFDAGITVVPNAETLSAPDDSSVFIGFEVADIEVIRFQRPEPGISPMAQRIARATRQREPMTQQA